MRKIKIKICGMRDQANMQTIARSNPDFFGLIFHPPSPRFASQNQVLNLPEFDAIERVGVFVNESVDNILEKQKRLNLKFVQLHGDETPRFCEDLKNTRSNLKIIKAFGVDENFDFEKTIDYVEAADFFLFDTKTVARGGSGQSFDWQILQRSAKIRKPFFLSGGIGIENVAQALAACANLPLYALDVNSRAEIAPGIKSDRIVEEIIKLIDK